MRHRDRACWRVVGGQGQTELGLPPTDVLLMVRSAASN